MSGTTPWGDTQGDSFNSVRPDGPQFLVIIIATYLAWDFLNPTFTAVERNRTWMHANANSAGNNAMKIIAEGRKNEGGNSKTTVNNTAGCLRALRGPGHLLALMILKFNDPDLVDPSNMVWNLGRAHKVLGNLGRNATSREIKMAYRLESRRWHPDHHVGKSSFKEAESRMQTINAAYEYLRELS
ncbi:hypothetical protein THAOC_02990 [Thalassiosira oceanica]|uniref:J domain-containing protein n=1 Tax=Thalassiosira oceanica TaxID=159749 RepID=K0TQ21_THAOC|nr:hypothetical protein THAOC_02990 [Thalassiosira oceanica]|eukprot:EJK75287.1 hypothetical protein THAOC_02990 [Thalassiosira oceanica]